MLFVIYELNLQILFNIGNDFYYIRDYHKFVKESPSYYFSKDYLKHNLKMNVIMSKYDYEDAINCMEDFYKEISIDDISLKEEYYYHLGLIYLNYNKNELLIEKLIKYIDNKKILMLLVIAYMNVKNHKIYPLIFNKINNQEFSKYEELLKNICLYAKYKTTSNNVVNLHNLLKNKIFKQLSFSQNIYLEKIYKKELIEINLRCSKYKEACNILINNFNSFYK